LRILIRNEGKTAQDKSGALDVAEFTTAVRKGAERKLLIILFYSIEQREEYAISSWLTRSFH